MTNQQQVIQLIKTAKGQLEAIMRMIEDGAYCIDVCTQMLSCGAIISKANKQILSNHLSSCVLTASADNLPAKLEEVKKVLDKLI